MISLSIPFLLNASAESRTKKKQRKGQILVVMMSFGIQEERQKPLPAVFYTDGVERIIISLYVSIYILT
jgi:hypothetical protein